MHAQVISTTHPSVKALNEDKIPDSIVWGIVVISVLPFMLTLAGFDFSSEQLGLDETMQSAPNTTEAAFHHLSGAFTHTLLEWSAVCVAIFTVCLAFSHYAITRDITTPIIGSALVCAGFMDAFHTLAADRLITSVADNRSLIPFTWAVCRVFNALIMMVGVCLLLRERKQKIPARLSFVVTTSVFFAVIAYTIIHYAATRSNLPQTMFPDNLITRPWDFIPLLLYLVCGLYVFPLYYRKYPSIFAHGLIISTIPDVIVEAHMAFGSTALFDSDFNIAHFLKIIAYSVPLAGLMLDHAATHHKQKITLDRHNKTNVDLKKTRTRLKYLMKTSPSVIYSMNLSPSFHGTFISENITTLTGHSTHDLLTRDFWYTHLHPDEATGVLETLNDLLVQKKQHITLEYQFKHRLGHYLWIHDAATVTYTRSGRPLELIGSWIDISDTKTKECELIRVNRQLDDFAYIASHDLKEPLRGIHNYSNFLLEDYADKLDEEGQSKLKTLTRLTQRMEDLINSLLDFSRLGRVNISHETTNMNDVLSNVLDTLHVGLESEKIEIRIPKPLPSIACDPVLIGEVFSNLISNAKKYNDKPEKWIEIGYQDSSEMDNLPTALKSHQIPGYSIVFYVRDNGIGIREKHLNSVFRIFKRLHGRDKYGGGNGVGLTIIKKIIERHHGEIWVDSCFGEGTTFYFTLSGKNSHD